MGEWVGGWAGGWVGGGMGGWVGRWVDGGMGGWVGRWVGGLVGGRVGGWGGAARVGGAADKGKRARGSERGPHTHLAHLELLVLILCQLRGRHVLWVKSGGPLPRRALRAVACAERGGCGVGWVGLGWVRRLLAGRVGDWRARDGARVRWRHRAVRGAPAFSQPCPPTHPPTCPPTRPPTWRQRAGLAQPVLSLALQRRAALHRAVGKHHHTSVGAPLLTHAPKVGLRQGAGGWGGWAGRQVRGWVRGERGGGVGGCVGAGAA